MFLLIRCQAITCVRGLQNGSWVPTFLVVDLDSAYFSSRADQNLRYTNYIHRTDHSWIELDTARVISVRSILPNTTVTLQAWNYKLWVCLTYRNTDTWELSWCQLSYHWRHTRLSWRQHLVPPLIAKLSSRQPSVSVISNKHAYGFVMPWFVYLYESSCQIYMIHVAITLRVASSKLGTAIVPAKNAEG